MAKGADRSVPMDGLKPYPDPLHHLAAFASWPLVPSVKTLLSVLAMPPVSSTMQVVLEDGVEVGGVAAAAMVVEVRAFSRCINSRRNRHNLRKCLNRSRNRRDLSLCFNSNWWISNGRSSRSASRQQWLCWHWLVLCNVLIIISVQGLNSRRSR